MWESNNGCISLRFKLEPAKYNQESRMKHPLPILFITLLLAFSSNAFAESQDELTQAVVAYEVTLPRVEAYEAALSDLVEWARAHPKDTKKFRNNKNRVITLEAAGKQLESVPALKDILIKHQLTGEDMALLPVALLSSNAVVFSEKQGMTMPPGHFNVASVAMIRANEATVDKLMDRITSHWGVLRGEKKAASASVVSSAKPSAPAASITLEGKGACAYLTPEVIAEVFETAITAPTVLAEAGFDGCEVKGSENRWVRVKVFSAKSAGAAQSLYAAAFKKANARVGYSPEEVTGMGDAAYYDVNAASMRIKRGTENIVVEALGYGELEKIVKGAAAKIAANLK